MIDIYKKPKEFITFRIFEAGYNGHNQWMQKWIYFIFRLSILELSISFHKEYQKFEHVEIYYDWYIHVLHLGYFSIYWEGEPYFE